VLDAVTSNIDGYLRRDTCVSSTQPNKPNRSKQYLSPPRNIEVAGNIHFKNELSSPSVLDAPSTNTHVFLQKIYLFLHLS
jgi:hypothetical protein